MSWYGPEHSRPVCCEKYDYRSQFECFCQNNLWFIGPLYATMEHFDHFLGAFINLSQFLFFAPDPLKGSTFR